MDSILIILKKKWPKGFICPYTGTIFYNIRMYSRSQVSVYRTIGPLVLADLLVGDKKPVFLRFSTLEMTLFVHMYSIYELETVLCQF